MWFSGQYSVLHLKFCGWCRFSRRGEHQFICVANLMLCQFFSQRDHKTLKKIWSLRGSYPEIFSLSALKAWKAMNWPGGVATSRYMLALPLTYVPSLGLCIMNVHWCRTSNRFLTIFAFGMCHAMGCLQHITNIYQWRIQDFPEEGAPTPQGGGCQHTILPYFPKNCMIHTDTH